MNSHGPQVVVSRSNVRFWFVGCLGDCMVGRLLGRFRSVIALFVCPTYKLSSLFKSSFSFLKPSWGKKKKQKRKEKEKIL